jgi:hypothetical protein
MTFLLSLTWGGALSDFQVFTKEQLYVQCGGSLITKMDYDSLLSRLRFLKRLKGPNTTVQYGTVLGPSSTTMGFREPSTNA